MLSINNIHKKYGKNKVLKGTSLKVNKGEIVCVLGKNGEGKTTLLNIIGNSNCADKGDIVIDKFSLKENEKKYKKLLGYVQNSDNVKFFDHLTGFEVLEFCLTMYQVKSLSSKMREFIDNLELEEHLNKKVGDLSTGNKKKLMIICALIHNPQVIIMDEPTTGLDSVAKDELIKIIKKLSINKAILICTHELDVVKSLATKVAIIANGKIVDCDKEENLIKKYNKKTLFEVYKELRCAD